MTSNPSPVARVTSGLSLGFPVCTTDSGNWIPPRPEQRFSGKQCNAGSVGAAVISCHRTGARATSSLFSLPHFPFSLLVSFFTALLSLFLSPLSPPPPTPGLGPGVPTEPLFHAEERVTVHGQSGEALGSANPAPCFLGRPRGLGSTDSGRGEGL